MSHWSFAIVNGKLAEIHWDKMGDGTRRFYGHCYVNASEYDTKKEKDWIKKDTKTLRFSWRNKKYKYLGTKPMQYKTGSMKEWLRSVSH